MSKTECRIVAEVTAKPDRADDLRAVLIAMLAPSRAETGCLLYDLHDNVERPGHFVFVERWADEAAFIAHTETEHFRALGPAIDPLIESPPRLMKLTHIAG